MPASPFVLINVFVVDSSNQDRLVELLTTVTDQFVRHSPGFIRSRLHRSLDGTKVTLYAEWQSREAYEAMRVDTRPAVYLDEALTIAEFQPGMYEVVGEFAHPS
jgi:quinol monooxygenase YgiN